MLILLTFQNVELISLIKVIENRFVLVVTRLPLVVAFGQPGYACALW